MLLIRLFYMDLSWPFCPPSFYHPRKLKDRSLLSMHIFIYIYMPIQVFSPILLQTELLQVFRSHNHAANGCPFKFLSNGTTGSLMLSHDLGLRDRGISIQITGHSPSGNLNHVGASSNVPECMVKNSIAGFACANWQWRNCI